MSGEIVIKMQNIVKEFPGVRALDDVTFDVRKGEIHALCGENGAGKSTLIKILSGLYPYGTYEGSIEVHGQSAKFKGIRDSESEGIGVIYQELSLVPEMSVGENVFLGREPRKFGMVDWEKMMFNTRKVLDELGLNINPRSRIKYLGIGKQQLVEIAKALSLNSNILILDEPTAALTETDVELLMGILKKLKERGVSCIYISHKLDELFQIADRITVLRDGKTIKTHEVNDVDKHTLISEMVGRELTEMFPKVRVEPGEVVFEVKNISAYNPDVEGRKLVDDVSFKVRAGEVLGISGLMGAGRTELLNVIFGAHNGRTEGEIFLNGSKIKNRSPRDAIEAGFGLISEDRKKYGLVLIQSVSKNITLSALKRVVARFFINLNKEHRYSENMVQDLNIKTPNLEVEVNTLSGGNQQKVVIAKSLMTQPKVLFLDEPTRGIDVGAKTEIYQIINKLVAEGVGVIMVSSELPEILGMSDRVMVMREGVKAAEMDIGEATQEKIMYAATGGQ